MSFSLGTSGKTPQEACENIRQALASYVGIPMKDAIAKAAEGVSSETNEACPVSFSVSGHFEADGSGSVTVGYTVGAPVPKKEPLVVDGSTDQAQ